MIGKFALFIKKIFDWFKSDLCFFNYFVLAFKITNSNIILATPLILFIFFTTFYLAFSMVSSINFIIVTLLFILMSAVFFSGWFYSVKLAVNNEYDTKDTFALLKSFPVGVGIFFTKYLWLVLLYFMLMFIVTIFTYKSGQILIGDIGVSSSVLLNALSSVESTTELLKGLSIEQQQKLAYWNLYFLFSTTLYSFLTFLWAPQLTYRKESVIKALFKSLKKLFAKFFKNLTIFMYLLLIYLLVSVCSALFRAPLIQYLFSIIYFYFLVYAAVLIFLYYKREFCENE